MDYDPGAAEWPCAATSPDVAAPPQYRPYQPEALAGARVWYSSAAVAVAHGDQGAAAVQAAERSASRSAATTAPMAPQQASATGAEPDLIDLAATDEHPEARSAATAPAVTHECRDVRDADAAVPQSATVSSREPPDLYVCPITQVPVHACY